MAAQLGLPGLDVLRQFLHTVLCDENKFQLITLRAAGVEVGQHHGDQVQVNELPDASGGLRLMLQRGSRGDQP